MNYWILLRINPNLPDQKFIHPTMTPVCWARPICIYPGGSMRMDHWLCLRIWVNFPNFFWKPLKKIKVFRTKDTRVWCSMSHFGFYTLIITKFYLPKMLSIRFFCQFHLTRANNYLWNLIFWLHYTFLGVVHTQYSYISLDSYHKQKKIGIWKGNELYCCSHIFAIKILLSLFPYHNYISLLSYYSAFIRKNNSCFADIGI